MTTADHPLDLIYATREVRIAATHVPDCKPSLAYVEIYVTDDHGQWGLLTNFEVDPFAEPEVRAEVLNATHRVVEALLT